MRVKIHLHRQIKILTNLKMEKEIIISFFKKLQNELTFVQNEMKNDLENNPMFKTNTKESMQVIVL